MERARRLRTKVKDRFQLMVRRATASEAADLIEDLVADGILTVGANTTGEPLVVAYRLGDGIGHVGGKVTIGKFCTFGEDVTILAGGQHRSDWVTAFPFRDHWDLPGKFADGHPAAVDDTIIGNDVWVGREAFLLPGVTIGHGAIIGARAVVTKDVEPYTIVAGNPARVIRRRFDDEEIDRLLAIAWWDWPEADIRGAIGVLNADNGIDRLAELER